MSSNYWSTFVQNSDFLESSRIEIMNADMAAYVADKLGLKPGMRVLDVGCGTGALEYYLAHVSENVQYTGIDTDSDLIACAGGKPHSDSRRNSFTFIECDASKLPFPDSSFDVVVSHTFLTAAVCYEAALLEMKRVCVPEGLIGTINIADFTKAVIRREGWRSKSEADFRFGILLEKFLSSCERLYPLSRAREGISPERIPSFFEDSGLKDVSVFPVGSFFSLSNGEQVLPANVRKSYLDGMLSSLFKRISAYEALPGFCRIMPGSELKAGVRQMH